MANSNPNCMNFIFKSPQKVHGVVIGNNIGVSGGWNSGYLDGVDVFVRKSGSNDF